MGIGMNGARQFHFPAVLHNFGRLWLQGRIGIITRNACEDVHDPVRPATFADHRPWPRRRRFKEEEVASPYAREIRNRSSTLNVAVAAKVLPEARNRRHSQ